MSPAFRFHELPLEGLILIKRSARLDTRGSFARMFCDDEFRAAGIDLGVRQVNHSVTDHAGTVRGMHFQLPPSREDKLVICQRGRILDVSVDIRKDSVTFLKWHAEILSAKNEASLYIPAGFAHGFQSLEDDCSVLYLHTQEYVPGLEGALNALDPAIDIEWPEEVSNMSDRDHDHPYLDSEFQGYVFS